MPLSIPLFLALFIRRVPWWSGLFSAGCALVPSAISVRASEPWPFQREILVGVVVGVAAFLATIPFWRFAGAAFREQVRQFFVKMHTPVDFVREVGTASDHRQLRNTGMFAAIIGSLVCLLTLLPNPWAARLQILAVGGSVAVLGALMSWYGRSRTPPTVADLAAVEPTQEATEPANA
jgi:hypothetical protein